MARSPIVRAFRGAILTDKNWLSHFPGLESLPEDAVRALLEQSKQIKLPAGARVFGPGVAPESFLLLIKGTLRIQQVSESGREIVLYRVTAGESCALTTACLMGYEDYQAEAIVESDAEAVAIPRATFDTLIARSPEFRSFVFTAFSRRVTNLFHIIEEVAFSRIDMRLAEKLTELADSDQRLEITHQQLAAELGSAREVISRQLKEFQNRGWITLARGMIELKNYAALQKLAQSY